MAERTRSQRLTRLADSYLYVCTPARTDLETFATSVTAAGVDALQVREKGVEARAELALIALVAEGVRTHGALLSVNDRADLAVLAGADILHVGQGDLSPADARRVVGPEMLIGLSTHTPEQAHDAANDPDVDYFCAGPVYATPTKPGRPAVGLAQIRAAAEVANGKPWFAIGGIDLSNLDDVMAAGALRVVVVRAVTGAADPEKAAIELRNRLRAPR